MNCGNYLCRFLFVRNGEHGKIVFRHNNFKCPAIIKSFFVAEKADIFGCAACVAAAGDDKIGALTSAKIGGADKT